MTKQKLAVTLIALSAFVPNLILTTETLAQEIADDTMNATAKIVSPVAFNPSFNFKLNFQSFAVLDDGSFLVTPNGGHTIVNGVTVGGATPATGIIKVPQSVTFTLSVPTYKLGSVLMKNLGGGVPSKEMTVKSLHFAAKSGLVGITANLSNGKAMITGAKVTSTNDEGVFLLGARILFDGDDVAGTYQGSFIVRITL